MTLCHLVGIEIYFFASLYVLCIRHSKGTSYHVLCESLTEQTIDSMLHKDFSIMIYLNRHNIDLDPGTSQRLRDLESGKHIQNRQARS